MRASRKPGRREERAELLLRPLPAAGDDQHVDVVGGGAAARERARRSARGRRPRRCSSFPSAGIAARTLRRISRGLLVVPVVDHVLQQVGVGARAAPSSKKLPPTTSQRSATPASRDVRARALGRHAADRRRCRAASGSRCRIPIRSAPLPPPTSATVREAREVVRGRHRGGGLRRERRHRLVEDRGRLGVVRHRGERIAVRARACGTPARRCARTYSSSVQLVLDAGPANSITMARIEPGTSSRSSSPSGSEREAAVLLLREDARRSRAGAARAGAPRVRADGARRAPRRRAARRASRSATPSFAATWSARDT